MVGGIDRSVEPHLISPGFWYDSINVRFNRGKISLYPKKSFWLTQLVRTPITALVTLPVGTSNLVNLIAFTGGKAFRVNYQKLPVSLPGTNKFSIGDGAYLRW